MPVSKAKPVAMVKIPRVGLIEVVPSRPPPRPAQQLRHFLLQERLDALLDLPARPRLQRLPPGRGQRLGRRAMLRHKAALLPPGGDPDPVENYSQTTGRYVAFSFIYTPSQLTSPTRACQVMSDVGSRPGEPWPAAATESPRFLPLPPESLRAGRCPRPGWSRLRASRCTARMLPAAEPLL